jgi:hypothetical protein
LIQNQYRMVQHRLSRLNVSSFILAQSSRVCKEKGEEQVLKIPI